MNFTDYNHLRQISMEMDDCIRDCIEAERIARTTPSQSFFMARRALEALYKEQCKKYDIFFRDLYGAIGEVCRHIGKNWKSIQDKSDEIRTNGNDNVHGSIDVKLKKAIDNLAMLYEILGMFYGRPQGKKFLTKRVPFNSYEIIRQSNDRAIIQLERYFVKDPNNRTYYLQSLSNQSMREFEARRNEANNRVYENSGRNSRLLLPIPISVPENSDRQLLICEAYPDSFLLDELEGALPLKVALDIGLNLIDALTELKDMGMHHRNICPACILVDRRGDRYDACLLDLQMSKIVGSAVTINANLISVYDSSNFVPSIIWRRTLSNINWEKVDAYAVGKIVLFCLDKSLVQANNLSQLTAHPELKNNDPMLQLYRDILRQDPRLTAVPTLDQLREVFVRGKDLCN